MEEQDELIVSLNYRKSFDLDFESLYTKAEEDHSFYKFMNPCYKINEETVDG